MGRRASRRFLAALALLACAAAWAQAPLGAPAVNPTPPTAIPTPPTALPTVIPAQAGIHDQRADAAVAPTPASSAPAACPKPGEITAVHLYGLWRAEFQGLWQGATLLIEKHPEYAQSFSGTINRNGERARLAGDVEDGEFTLEESADGKRIAAVWTGDVADGSCGREIRGTWQAEGGARSHAFVLKKLDR